MAVAIIKLVVEIFTMYLKCHNSMALNIMMINANIFASGFFVLFLKIVPSAIGSSEEKLYKFVFFSLSGGVLVVTSAIVEAEVVFSTVCEILVSLL